jgi:hypothetical protein
MRTHRAWLGVMPKLNDVVQQLRGVEGAIIGQTYNVYRLTSASNGSVISGIPLYTNYPMYLKEKAMKVVVENDAFNLLVWEGKVDNIDIQLGDFFVEVGYGNDKGIWVYAQGRPMHPNIFVRAETRSFITRPYTLAGSVAEQPGPADPDVVVQQAYGGTHIEIEKYLTLANGQYTFDPNATVGASVPVGIQALNRVRDGSIPKVPTKQYRTHHTIYAPLIPGEMLDLQDRINASAGDRYETMEVHSTGSTGLYGNIIIAERMPT